MNAKKTRSLIVWIAILAGVFTFGYAVIKTVNNAIQHKVEERAQELARTQAEAPQTPPEAKNTVDGAVSTDTLFGIALIADWGQFSPTEAGNIKMAYRRGAALVEIQGGVQKNTTFFITDGPEWVQVTKSSILEFYAAPR